MQFIMSNSVEQEYARLMPPLTQHRQFLADMIPHLKEYNEQIRKASSARTNIPRSSHIRICDDVIPTNMPTNDPTDETMGQDSQCDITSPVKNETIALSVRDANFSLGLSLRVFIESHHRPPKNYRLRLNEGITAGFVQGTEDSWYVHFPHSQEAANIIQEFAENNFATPHRDSGELRTLGNRFATSTKSRGPQAWVSCEVIYEMLKSPPYNLSDVLRYMCGMRWPDIDEHRQMLSYYKTNSPINTENATRPGTLALWQHREMARLTMGEYISIPEALYKQMGHAFLEQEIPHLATKGSNAGKIAFVRDPKHGENDTQSVMKPGKYLRRVLNSQVSDQQLKEMVAELNAASTFEVMEADEPEDIARVYMEGPQSCMSYGRGQFDDCVDTDGIWHHPSEVYGHPDNNIVVIYVVTNDQIAARAVTNFKSEQYARIYGSDWCKTALAILKDHIEEVLGFSQNEYALSGQKLLRIDTQTGDIICPYIDTENDGVDVYDTYLRCGGDEHTPNHSTGTLETGTIDQETCSACNDSYPEEDRTPVHDEDGDECGNVCTDCQRDVVPAFVNGNMYTVTVMEDRTTELRFTARTRHDSGTAIHENFDDWDIFINVVMDINGEAIDRDTAIQLFDENGNGTDEYVNEEDIPQVDSLGDLIKYATFGYVAIDREAYCPADLVFDETNDEIVPINSLDMSEYTLVQGLTYREIDHDQDTI